jgi:phage terminase small subunit
MFLSLVSPEIQRTFEEEMMANPNMKFKDMADSFWGTYGRVTKEKVKNNKDRLTIVWQPHQGFEALVAQIETCLVYSYFAKKLIPDGELIDAFLIYVKQTGCHQIGYDRWELLPAAQKTGWADTKYWWKKKYLRAKPTISARQAGYGMNAAEEAAEDAQYNQSVAQFTSGHAASQRSIANLTATNAAQQQQITAL